MAVVTTNLGVGTAYGDAVAAGYTGTKEQWQALMANYATVGQQAAQSAQTASTAASTATTAAQTATTKASEASASATAAQEAAESINSPDTTLTQSGKAADAKAAGDELSTIKEELIDEVAFNFSYIATDNWTLGWRNGYFNRSTGEINGTSNIYIRTLFDTYNALNVDGAFKVYAKVPTGYAVSICVYDRDGNFLRSYGNNNSTSDEATNEISGVLNDGENVGLTVGLFRGSTALNFLTSEFISQIILKFYVNRAAHNEKVATQDISLMSIACAKETNYTDGTFPTVDYYLIMGRNRTFWITKDFSTLKRAFRTPFDPICYKFAILKNGDVIAVYRSERIQTGSSDADNRKNPYVFLASENWEICHEVDFGTSLKPSGWLENCGFCSMPNGSAMFCEYTRPGVETANCWKLSGDLTMPSNWVVVKSFTLSGELNSGFKHCHSVSYDFYNDVYYLTTGDDNVGAQVWYSTNAGSTWTIAREPSEKYCRVLNMIFTENYIYWASDTTLVDMHYLFRCGRDENGVIDYSTVTEIADLYQSGVATYGISYLRQLNAIVILDKCDSARRSMPLKLYDLSANQLVTIGTIYPVSDSTDRVGFRTEYSNFNPFDNSIVMGFGTTQSVGHYENVNKGLGNVSGDYAERVNNMRLIIYKTNDGFGYLTRLAFSV